MPNSSPARTVVVTAPSRLHFGMFSFGRPDVRQFGGVGVMIDTPALRLRLEPAQRFQVQGPSAARAAEFAHRVWRHLLAEGAVAGRDQPACAITVEQAPPEHIGLGSGTPLGLSVAAGICALLGLEVQLATRLAQLSGRGLRSAVGTYGFWLGGLIVDAGKLPGETISKLGARQALPNEWRFVVIASRNVTGLAGEAERDAFANLPPVPPETTDELEREALRHLIPAAAESNFTEFGESLYRFGRTAGMCFAHRQGGPFANAEIAELVDWLRREGIAGVGQSSWGPTVFALVASAHEAQRWTRAIRDHLGSAEYDIWTAAPANEGARLEVVEPRL